MTDKKRKTPQRESTGHRSNCKIIEATVAPAVKAKTCCWLKRGLRSLGVVVLLGIGDVVVFGGGF